MACGQTKTSQATECRLVQHCGSERNPVAVVSRMKFLGLFPYSGTVRATRCWRKLSQGGGTAIVIVHRTVEYRRIWQCSSRLSCSTGTCAHRYNGTGVTAQSRVLREKHDRATSSVEEREVSSAVPIATVRSNCNNTCTFSCGCFHRHKTPFLPSSTGKSTLIMCTSNKASYSQSWGEIQKRSDPSTTNTVRWVQEGKWAGNWHSQRRFASTMPEQQDERKSDSSNSNSRRIGRAGQRVFEEPFQGQLKPSDVSNSCAHLMKVLWLKLKMGCCNIMYDALEVLIAL